MLRALLTLLLLLPGLAAAGTPFVLPPGERIGDWTPHLSEVDFELTAGVGDGASVEVQAVGERWLLRIVDVHGARSERWLDPPATSLGREDLVSLAYSLVHPPGSAAPSWSELAANLPAVEPAAEPVPPPRAEPPPARPAPEPEPEPAPPEVVAVVEPPPPAPEPVPEPEEPDPFEVPEEELPPPSTPAPPPSTYESVALDGVAATDRWRPGPWVRAGGAAVLRGGVTPSAMGQFGAGLRLHYRGLPEALRLGVELGVTTPARYLGLDSDPTRRDVDLGAVFGFDFPSLPRFRLPLVVAARAGIGWRIFEGGGEVAPVQTVTTGWLGGEVSALITLRPRQEAPVRAHVEPFATAQLDFRPIPIQMGPDGEAVETPVVSARFGLRVLFDAGSARVRARPPRTPVVADSGAAPDDDAPGTLQTK